MRFFFKLAISILVAVVVGGLLTYPAWLLTLHFADYRPDRVMHRVAELLLVIALVWVLRSEGLADRAAFGYGIPRPIFLRQLAVGYAAGIVLMTLVIGTLFALHLRTFKPGIDGSHAMSLAIAGVFTGIFVGFLEETILRGATFSVIQRESGVVYAIVLTSLLYAFVHFIGGDLRIPASEMNFMAGPRIAADVFSQYAHPSQLFDSFMALFALGVLLALIRLRTGAIAGGVGLHAGAVCIITITRNSSVVNPTASLSWMVGSYDGVIGWFVFVCILIVGAAFWRINARSISISRRPLNQRLQ